MKLNVSMPVLKILMPIGLSFYTFKSIGYVIDVYREDIKAEKHFGMYALYLLFFPEILAGPIDRGGNLLPQFYQKHDFEYKRISDGLKLIAWGAFKKVVIADRIAVIVNNVYGDLDSFHGIPLIINSVLFTFQMYYDFSGYSDIAIGSGKILGFNLPDNFNVPLISQSITEFWRRWHISLSTWLRDYLYTPMAIATRHWGIKAIVFSTFITFVIAGLWHGAGWTFIIFGALHGGALVYEILSRNFRKKLTKSLPTKLYNLFCNFLAFSYLTLTFIFFRAENLSQAGMYISKIFTSFNFKTGGYKFGIGQFEFWMLIILIILSMILEVYTSKKEGLVKYISAKPAYLRWGFYYLIILFIIFYGEFGENNFIYFKF
jgi:D-alanyl-lipoteichoic acid acyltransferase DltB (MBOAT superfamily)